MPTRSVGKPTLSVGFVDADRPATPSYQMERMNMSGDDRIQQFKTMAEADPNNELGHFSLGKAYLEAGRFDDAVVPLKRALEINPRMSKAHQLLADAHDRAGNRETAIKTLEQGVMVADEQGEFKTRDSMAKQLAAWDVTVPLFAKVRTPSGAATGSTAAVKGFQCSRCGRPSGKMEKPPMKGKLGTKVFENVCAGCWSEWIPMGTKVINELGLVLMSPSGSQAYDQHMLEFLQLEER
ncbi:MAG: Fe(2+)-trafficking protein [Planctomycetes bacterium]|nr:Fe(2+)-trafficking protein [Planctomycetota bacterium]